jgi:hypothetical protein
VKPFLLISCCLAALLVASCSKSPSIDGTWKNGDGNLITFGPDSSVLLGQEGLQGGDSGSYSLQNGFIRVVTRAQADNLGSFHNEYFLIQRNDSLLLQKLTLFRGQDYHEIMIDSLAQRMGKSPQRFAFTRRASK